MVQEISISTAIDAYLASVSLARSENTCRTYRNGMAVFTRALSDHKIHSEKSSVSSLSEQPLVWLINALKSSAPTTERLYLSAVTGFYEFLAAENLADVNLPKIRLLIRQRARRTGIRLPQFPREEIDQLLIYVLNLAGVPVETEVEQLRQLRDRAFIITLADTGLRVHEACALRRGDIDWNEGRAVIIGKGDKQAVIRFSNRSLRCLKDYLAARAKRDGASGKPLTSLALFARHDPGAGNKVSPITTTTGRNILTDRVRQALGEDAVGHITPHSLRHYFVTTVLRASGNLKLAQELARHQNIAVTQRYAHLNDDELDRGYANIFDAGDA